ncbi:MAG TPA: AgmX/PglI C-terminal domain-containing protein [Gammaproteobacteria bacterium]
MIAATYHDLALEWNPRRSGDTKFNLLAISVLAVLLLIGFMFSSIEVPREERKIRVVPERIAQFITEKEKPKPIVKPEPEKPKPKPKPVIKKIPEKTETKPLTKSQEKAREKAADSGLLALSNDLVDLMDTSAVSAMVSGKVKNASSATQEASSVNKQLLMADAGKGSGGVDSGQYTTIASKTNLSSREITKVKESLLAGDAKKTDQSKAKSARTGNVRAEEEITIVFDQNKSKLYSIYNRARRSNPGLKGKIVLEITIEPNGKVSEVRVISSELNDKNLETSILSRIKLFNFGEGNVKAVTVTYPIEFLPS